MPMTVSITPELEFKLDRVASLTKCDVDTVLNNLISESVDAKLERLAAIEEGLADIEAGRTEEHEDVINEVLADIYKMVAAQS